MLAEKLSAGDEVICANNIDCSLEVGKVYRVKSIVDETLLLLEGIDLKYFHWRFNKKKSIAETNLLPQEDIKKKAAIEHWVTEPIVNTVVFAQKSVRYLLVYSVISCIVLGAVNPMHIKKLLPKVNIQWQK